MILKKSEQKTPIIIDLTGPEGNAFALLGYVKTFGKLLSWDNDKIRNVMDSMQSSDYENLVKVFDKHFGSFVTLYR